MKTIVDVIRAITVTMEVSIGVPVTNKDIREGFTRPCLYVEPTSMTDGRIGDLLDDTYSIDVFYFAERREKGYLELLEKRQTMRVLLDKPSEVVADEFYIYPEDVTHDINRADTVLVSSFTVQTVQDRPDDDAAELTSELSTNIIKE